MFGGSLFSTRRLSGVGEGMEEDEDGEQGVVGDVLGAKGGGGSDSSDDEFVEYEDEQGEFIMQQLEQVATDNARALIAKRFERPEALEDIDQWFPIEKQRLEIAKAQLSTTIHGKLFAVKRVSDVVGVMSDTSLQYLEEHFHEVQNQCRIGGEAFEKYQRLRRVSIAQHNLHGTISQVHLFWDIPGRAALLMEKLSEDLSVIEVANAEAEVFEAWRDDIIHLVTMLRDTQRVSADAGAHYATVTPGSPTTINGLKFFHNSRRASDVDAEVLLRVLSRHFDAVQNLAFLVRERLWRSARGAFALTKDAPDTMRSVLKVVERMQHYEEVKIERQVKRRREAFGAENAEIFQSMAHPEDIIGTFREFLAQGAESVAVQHYAMRIFAQADDGKEGVFATLGACEALAEDLEMVKSLMAPIFPESFDIVGVHKAAFEAHLLHQISRFYDDNAREQMNAGDMLSILGWLRTYAQANGRSAALLEAEQSVLHMYLDSNRRVMEQWFSNMTAKRAEQRFEGPHGELMTTFPEDLFHALHIVLDIAKQKLSGHQLSLVIRECLSILEDFQVNEASTLADSATVEQLDYLCRVVNDNDRLQESCDAFLADVGVSLAPEVQSATEEFIEDLTSQLLRNALRVTKIIEIAIYDDLRQQGIVAQLFSEAWAQASEEPMQTLVETFLDYANDLRVWLVPFFFKKWLISVYRKCASLMVEEVLAGATPRLVSCSRATLAARLRADAGYIRQQFEEAFRRYGISNERVGFAGELNALFLLADFVEDVDAHCLETATLPDSAVLLLQEFPRELCENVLLRLLDVRSRAVFEGRVLEDGLRRRYAQGVHKLLERLPEGTADIDPVAAERQLRYDLKHLAPENYDDSRFLDFQSKIGFSARSKLSWVRRIAAGRN